MSEAITDLTRCANCQMALSDAFCAHCGQKAKPLNPTMRELTGDVLAEVTDVDNRLFRSVRYLFTRPGFLSREHAEGRRARYVSPVRLYLIFSVAFFAAVSLVARREAMLDPELSFTIEDGAANGQETLDTWLPRIMFVLVPLCGFCVMLFTRSVGRHYPEHFHFGLHLHAFWFGLFAVMAPLEWIASKRVSDVMSLGRVVVLLAYAVMAFRVAYGGGWWRSIGRAVGVFVTYMLLLGLVVSALIGAAMFATRQAAE
jgi:hypothetical protein